MMKRIYIMMVLVSCLACEDILPDQDISNDTVVLIAPSNDAVLNITTINFSWEAVQDADHYHLQIAQPSFQAALQIIQDTIITSNQYSTSLSANSYEWRVRGENGAYQTNYTTQNFSVEE